MNPDSDPSAQRRFALLKARAGSGLLRWAATLVALAMLAVVAYQAYAWLVANVAQRSAVTEAPQAAASASAPESIVPPPLSAAAVTEPPAPAVTGGSINRCVINGQLTYTNAPCPEGSRAVNEDAPPVMTAQPPPLADGVSQQAATCNFLGAEIARLDYEFGQPLPPAVLDRISTRLTDLRAQVGVARCAPPPKPADSAASAPERRRAPAKGTDESRR